MMRVGGLATGMDIEQMVNRLMDAERIPYTKLMQDRTKLTWKQDAFRDLNKSLLELDQLTLDMKLSHTYNAKKVSSTQQEAITGRPSSSAGNGTYQIEVKELATAAINMSTGKVGQEIDEEFIGDYTFQTYAENGDLQKHDFTVEKGDTVDDVLDKISTGESPVRAFYDKTAKKVIMETTRTGKYSTIVESQANEEPQGKQPEIVFTDESKDFFENVLGLKMENETGGKDAVFVYNYGAELTSKNNTYELDGIVFEFHNVTNEAARLSVTTDEDAVFESIVQFVDKYNEVVEKFNGTQQEERFRDFFPLTDEQKKEMSEDEVKQWEEKAQSGILKGESIISNGLFNMRSSWYGAVHNDSAFSSITEVGITTTNRYLDGGKLEIDEEALRKAISEDVESVQALFSNSSEGSSRGIIHRLDDQIDQISRKINDRAGKGTDTFDNYALGKRMKEINSRITDFEARLTRIETRYWNQFTQMEKAIQRLNDQSSQLFSQFGGM